MNRKPRQGDSSDASSLTDAGLSATGAEDPSETSMPQTDTPSPTTVSLSDVQLAGLRYYEEMGVKRSAFKRLYRDAKALSRKAEIVMVEAKDTELASEFLRYVETIKDWLKWVERPNTPDLRERPRS